MTWDAEGRAYVGGKTSRDLAEEKRKRLLVTAPDRDHKGYSEEKCVRCGWVMGQPALNCQNDDTPHRFPSQGAVTAPDRKALAETVRSTYWDDIEVALTTLADGAYRDKALMAFDHLKARVQAGASEAEVEALKARLSELEEKA